MLRATLPFLAASAIAVAVLPAAAQTFPEPKPRISVTGEGEHAIRPDMALLSFSVMRQADTARQALDANNEAMAQVDRRAQGGWCRGSRPPDRRHPDQPALRLSARTRR